MLGSPTSQDLNLKIIMAHDQMIMRQKGLGQGYTVQDTKLWHIYTRVCTNLRKTREPNTYYYVESANFHNVIHFYHPSTPGTRRKPILLGKLSKNLWKSGSGNDSQNFAYQPAVLCRFLRRTRITRWTFAALSWLRLCCGHELLPLYTNRCAEFLWAVRQSPRVGQIPWIMTNFYACLRSDQL